MTTDIAQSYRRPRAVVARKLALPWQEGRVLAYLMGFCILVFVAQLPWHSREAYLNPTGVPFDARMGGALLGWVFIMPLVFYALAAVIRGIAHVFGGKGTGYTARLALFWSLLAVSPLALLWGLTAGFIGMGVQVNLVFGLLVLAFVWIFGNAIVESERAA